MKPLELAIEGFTCYRQEVLIDFRQLDVFAICGTTGSGKSSILDAMMYALYGHVPRVGSSGLQQLISLRCDRMSVRFDFQIGERAFRVVRGVRHGGSAEAQLEEYRDSKYVVKSSNKQVKKDIEDLLGLTDDHFKKSVILPQGEFSNFLKVRKGRREMLRDMLQLGIYQNLVGKARHHETRCETAIKEKSASIERDYANVSAQRLKDLEEQYAQLVKQQAELAEKRKVAETAKDQAREDHNKTAELEAKQAEDKRLKANNQEMQTAETSIKQAERAISIPPLHRDLRDKQQQQRKRQEIRDNLDQQRKSFEEAQQKAKQVLDRAQSDAEQLAPLGKLKDQLIQLAPKGEELARLRKELKQQEAKKAQLTADQDTHLATQKQRSQAHTQLTAELEMAQAALAAVGYDADVFDKLESQRERALQLGYERGALQKLNTEVKNQQSSHQTLQQSLTKLESQCQAAEKTLRENQARVNQVLEELEASKREHSAEHLRTGLVAGKACPVCLQKVSKLPDQQQILPFDSLGNDLESAQQTVTQSAGVHKAAEFELKNTRRQIEAAEEALATKCDERDQSSR